MLETWPFISGAAAPHLVGEWYTSVIQRALMLCLYKHTRAHCITTKYNDPKLDVGWSYQLPFASPLDFPSGHICMTHVIKPTIKIKHMARRFNHRNVIHRCCSMLHNK